MIKKIGLITVWALLSGSRLTAFGNEPIVSETLVEAEELMVAEEPSDAEKAQKLQQLDLSKRAGNFFEHVIDHGSFFLPKFGMAERKFIEDYYSGEVYLEIEYDVFPVGSFVGVYMKTRDFDLNDYEGLDFQIRRAPNVGFPESIRVEMKERHSIVRAFVPEDFREQWQTMRLMFRMNQSAPITEMDIVILNQGAGKYKKGAIQLRNFKLIPKVR